MVDRTALQKAQRARRAPLDAQCRAAPGSREAGIRWPEERDGGGADRCRQVRDTRPLGASVRWLSNEQTYWDGARIWTYDFPNDQVQAIAIDPRQVAVTKTIAGLGKGPGHSLVVLPDKKKAAINVAGDNLIAFLDLEHGSVDSTLQTGAFP